ncbi:MAG: histidinol-phosphate transaminase [Thermoanaerobacteraceae bacterium]|nr:histidinol-phosphate transaminase [Thermoanaerobacteraceae bacterium]
MSVKEIMRKKARDLEAFTPELADFTVEEIKKTLGLDRVAKLSFNENPWGPFPTAVEAIKKAAFSLNLYPDAVAKELRQALADLYGLPANFFVLSNGADEMIALLAQTFLDEGDEVVIPFPTFGQYFSSVTLMGAKPVKVGLKDYKIDLESVYNAITERTKMVILCNPNNPTGTIITGDEVKSFIRDVPEDVLVVIDEAYAEYVEDFKFISGTKLVQEINNNIIVVRTFSKIYALAAARVGYGVAKPEIIEAINKVRPPFNVNVLGQVGALNSLFDKESVERIKNYTMKAKRELYHFLDKLGISYVPSETNFVLIDTGKDCVEVFEFLAREGVIVRTADVWGLPTHIRLTIGSPEDMEFFYRTFKKLYE